MSSPGGFPQEAPKNFAKLRTFSEPPKFFEVFFQNFFRRLFNRSGPPPFPDAACRRLSVAGRSPPGVGPCGLRRSSFPKASAKLRTFSEPPKNPPEKSPYLTSVNQKHPQKPRIRTGTALKPPLPGSRWPRGGRHAARAAPRRIPPPGSGLIADRQPLQSGKRKEKKETADTVE